ncbi:hypothetical protein IGB42_02336 [Andreprevotia sp. IGB-42]|uniref:flagellar biosynthetic protein FliR n=1 Tax=Andreprevotia sp. IGB-42 TaxID=2497473 RepID=UPI00135C2DDF|nr:flagellar biosynthetic protein FliR [Andreprevotia sp. IGB-42]KAF0813407.1 hypothetical protein IGB42_02336 [Andreprevotia sp. IGB-42]
MSDSLGLVLRYDMARLVATLLCATRLATAISLTPVLAGVGVPVRLRLFLVLALSFCLAGMGLSGLPPVPTDVLDLVGMMLSELLFGAALAFGVFTAFGAFSLAGHLLDFQIGFNVGALFDPVSRRQTPILSRLFDLFAVLVFFVTQLHHTLLRAFAATLEAVPLGAFKGAVSPLVMAEQVSRMFVQGLKLAAPVMICLLLVELGMAVLSRNIPQLNVFVISLPLKVLIGLSMLAFSLRYLAPTVSKTLNMIFPFWERLLVA